MLPHIILGQKAESLARNQTIPFTVSPHGRPLPLRPQGQVLQVAQTVPPAGIQVFKYRICRGHLVPKDDTIDLADSV